MRYLILVSHGTFAPGLHNALGMMAGSDREDIRSTSLLDGMDVDTFRANFAELVGDITAEDEIILTADIIGGSPLTTALEVLTEKGLLGKTLAIGGMNLPLVLTAAFADAETPLEELEQELTGEAKDQIKRFDLGGDEGCAGDDLPGNGPKVCRFQIPQQRVSVCQLKHSPVILIGKFFIDLEPGDFFRGGIQRETVCVQRRRKLRVLFLRGQYFLMPLHLTAPFLPSP